MNNTCEELIKQITTMPGYIVVGDKMVRTEDGPLLLREEVVQQVAGYHPPPRVG